MSISIADDFYSGIREASVANKFSASELAKSMGVHYTYVYNALSKSANITLQTAVKMASAAGYDLVLKFVPREGKAELTGEDPGKLYNARSGNSKKAQKAAAKALKAAAAGDPEQVDPAQLGLGLGLL